MTDLPLYRVLKDETRQKILNFLGERRVASYTDLLTFLNVSTGKLNYHLKILAPFLIKGSDGYSLNETGENAYSVLRKFQTDPDSSERHFRSLSLVLLPLSLVLVFIPELYVQVTGVAALFAAVFFFYNSGNLRTNTLELMVILCVAFAGGSYGALPELIIYYPLAFTLRYIYSPFLAIVYSVVLFSTLVGWALTTKRRWILATALMLSISIFFFMIVISALYGPSGGGSIQMVFPLPGIFLLASAVSRGLARFSELFPAGST